ncbi:NifB/NifX family molybdenum-iron cluster-binding protein [Thermococcus henrietii]|uniref:NifB/NifX family molybdenum-iron cluster-binding protein n=1 Tax=Thermococcus henrietii TaxID=2016361 RepID=UPI000C080C73|nr:NifB/NifX family molybdenum-iron cluster-binding protein [Thermococcus henrietii]
MRIAIPVEEPSFEGEICEHFGRARYFAVFSVKEGMLNGAELIELPEEHEAGELPRLLKEKNVDVVLANRVGRKALAHFQSLGISVVTGLEGRAVEVVKAFLEGKD